MMMRWTLAVSVCVLVAAASGVEPEARPLSLHPENPHYFLFRGQPRVLVSSAEHYGAVLNGDFDYVKYLEELHAHGLNHTRLFSGAYVEPQGAFKIDRNTLAPAAGRYLTPWARADVPGYAHGGNKFDVTRWDDAYFQRLKDFVAQAARREIIVEVNLFCPFYEDAQWRLSPQNAANNVNGVGNVARTDVYTLDKHGGLLAVHEAMTRKMVAELRGFDNVYYEVCNEPYFGGVTMAWQHRIVDVIRDAEGDASTAHLISLNVANGKQRVERPHPGVSIFNFHYATPPDTVGLNYDLGKPIGDNETGFKGTADAPYRREAWEFLLAGGALFSHLDYSFTVGHEDGTFQYPATQPGGGNRNFRRQMRVLRSFVEGLDFLHMRPDPRRLGEPPPACSVRALVKPDELIGAYIHGRGPVTLKPELPAGRYAVEWLSPLDGERLMATDHDHGGGHLTLTSPAFDPDIALRVQRR